MSETSIAFNRELLGDTLAAIIREVPDEYDTSLPHEVQTDKDVVKIVPCKSCRRALVVNRFYSPANARCAECKPVKAAPTPSGGGTPANPVHPGKTDPATVTDLTRVLVNPTFATALCPVHPDDPEHEMELKCVSHSDNYGPSELTGYSGGQPVYRRTAIGETVTHQCLRCKATVSYSTTAQHQFRRINEVRSNQHVNGLGEMLGAREENAA